MTQRFLTRKCWVCVCAFAVVALSAAVIAFLLRPLFTNPREQKSRVRVAFVQIGAKIKGNIGPEAANIPLSVEDLHARGILSTEDVSFMKDHHVTYNPPGTTGALDQVILRIPFEGDVEYQFHWDGNVTKKPTGGR